MMGYIDTGCAKVQCSQCHGVSYKDITRHTPGGFKESIRLCLTCGHEKVFSVMITSDIQPPLVYVFEVPKPVDAEEF
jgi:hypothetical protein